MIKNKIILGSGSPRRKELLERAGFEVVVKKLNVEESFPKEITKNTVAEYLAKKKHQALTVEENEIGITADTTVLIDDEILEKPKDATEAKQILSKLSGQKHEVITGVCISTSTNQKSFSQITTVYFKPLKESEIDYYIRHHHPFDKAGAYGIQDWIGMIGIEKIEGCYYNVMGLPIQKLYEEIQNI